MKACILLDRDGVLNVERGDNVFRDEDFEVAPGVPEGLLRLKSAGYGLVVVTNQGGISKGLYSSDRVLELHGKLQEACGGVIDYLLFAPWHRSLSASLSAKPGSLMMERGLALTAAEPRFSWLVGDAERDLKAGKATGVNTILIPTCKEQESPLADKVCRNFTEAVDWILESRVRESFPGL